MRKATVYSSQFQRVGDPCFQLRFGPAVSVYMMEMANAAEAEVRRWKPSSEAKSCNQKQVPGLERGLSR